MSSSNGELTVPSHCSSYLRWSRPSLGIGVTFLLPPCGMIESDGLVPPPDASTMLGQLHERFMLNVGNTVEAFRQLADQLHRAPAAPEVLDALSRELHRIRGTAGSYGFLDVGRLADAFDQVVARWVGDLTLDRSRRSAVVRQFARILAAAFDEGSAPAVDERSAPILLVDVPDGEATGLIVEALARGHFVQRLPAVVAQPAIDARPFGAVIAPAHVPLTVPDPSAHILLRDREGALVPHGANGQVVELGTPPTEILQMIEAHVARSSGAGATVLVLDDAGGTLEIMQRVTAREGTHVVSRPWDADPNVALQELRPVLVVIPWRAREVLAPMGTRGPGGGGSSAWPGRDTVATLRYLRADRRYAELPLLVLGSPLDQETRTALVEAGADDLQPTPVVEVELARRVAHLIEVRRLRLTARSIHPETALTLPERTRRDFDEVLREATERTRATSLVIMRPLVPPDGPQRATQWQRECAMVARTLTEDAAASGFLDDTALGILLPMNAEEAMARLTPFAKVASEHPVAWAAGVVEQVPGAEAVFPELLHAAEEAWLVARDHGELVRRWDPSDVTVAPDVILVEDDTALAELVMYALSARGLTHRRFQDGPAALAALVRLRCHRRQPILIVDVNLPGLDGFSLFDRLRVERPGRYKVVFMSVRGSEADQLRALRAGALDYLPKPVSLRVLLAKIAVWRSQDAPE